MSYDYPPFAAALVDDVLQDETPLRRSDGIPHKIQADKDRHTVATLDLIPYKGAPHPATAYSYFDGSRNITDLLGGYRAAREDHDFEADVTNALTNVSDYATQFLNSILAKAKTSFTNDQATLIGEWVKYLDVYTAVKAMESLLHSKADIALLEVARERGWFVHFDHLAIRCGTKARGDAERVAQLLKDKHGYGSSQLDEESYYQFSDGWNAYPVYKILENGQLLRVFIDQSDSDHPSQIIQHWNRIYGYTAHHLAMRATRLEDNRRIAVPLQEIIAALEQRGIEILTPTGHYTDGLLLQVFTKPERNIAIPDALKKEVVAIDVGLERTIENAKLLELVSRKEMNPHLAKRFFELYGLDYDPHNPLHSAPVYQYFLPAQAAHVIKTSVQEG